MNPLDAVTQAQVLERGGFRVDQWEVDNPSSRGHIAVIATAV